MYLLLLMLRLYHFNSRPHEEVDLVQEVTYSGVESFQLTTSRRGRRASDGKISVIVISTHDLTKRSTGCEIDEVQQHVFQLTTSRRGRPVAEYDSENDCAISTHDLTKRST